VLAGIGALVVAAPLTTQGNSIAKSVSSPAYALLSHDGTSDNGNEIDGNDDNYANGTHVEDSTGTHVDTNGTHIEDVHTTGIHAVEISDGSNASVTSFATGLLTQNQTPAQPRVKWKTRGSAAGSRTSGSSTTSPAVSVAVTGTSAKPAKSAESESTSSATRTPGSVSAQNNETSTRSKVRTSRTSAARR
jgi:hypothetical protein